MRGKRWRRGRKHIPWLVRRRWGGRRRRWRRMGGWRRRRRRRRRRRGRRGRRSLRWRRRGQGRRRQGRRRRGGGGAGGGGGAAGGEGSVQSAHVRRQYERMSWCLATLEQLSSTQHTRLFAQYAPPSSSSHGGGAAGAGGGTAGAGGGAAGEGGGAVGSGGEGMGGGGEGERGQNDALRTYIRSQYWLSQLSTAAVQKQMVPCCRACVKLQSPPPKYVVAHLSGLSNSDQSGRDAHSALEASRQPSFGVALI